ncbi:MAG TPA: GldG family protein [Burkholderiales bacterium]|nr:GldG family protein [Burkholderiales bacterium]
MEHSPVEFGAVAWFAGWLVAVGLLFWIGLRLPLQMRFGGWKHVAFNVAVVVAAVAITVLANTALTLHDLHVDLTRERIYTPSQRALQVVDELRRPVRLTYFYRGQDPEGRRMKDVLGVMARRSALLDLRLVDPDKEPALAREAGVRIYNAGVLEAEDRKLLVQTTDENEIALGIQRVLRERVVTVCFLEGHGEFPMDNFEFHTHVEGVATHSHGDASSQYVQMPGHGIGRLRRALEAQGYVARKVVLATAPAVPDECQALIAANPRTTFLPAESAAVEAYLRHGGALLALFDLGFVLEPHLAALLEQLGVRLPQEAVVDPLSHYATDSEMVAVTGYEPGPMTRGLSMTFFAGARPLEAVTPAASLMATPLFASSRDSYTRAVQQVGAREVGATRPGGSAHPPRLGPRVLAMAVEGRLPGAAPGAPPMRAVIVGDADFASNSFLPYLANGDLALAIVRWLAREERGTAVARRIPVPPMILLTGAQMRGIFLVVELLLPLAAFALAVLAWWRRR